MTSGGVARPRVDGGQRVGVRLVGVRFVGVRLVGGCEGRLGRLGHGGHSFGVGRRSDEGGELFESRPRRRGVLREACRVEGEVGEEGARLHGQRERALDGRGEVGHRGRLETRGLRERGDEELDRGLEIGRECRGLDAHLLKALLGRVLGKRGQALGDELARVLGKHVGLDVLAVLGHLVVLKQGDGGRLERSRCLGRMLARLLERLKSAAQPLVGENRLLLLDE
mmetsp:Transcript_31062/g.99342  ORF Transcript_31062/g.99342 Transcript_31062/m.99342 type:complete len:225 (+) Transcript_31062:123-797(+)